MNLRKDHSHASTTSNRESHAVSFLAMRPFGAARRTLEGCKPWGRQQEELAWRLPCSQFSLTLVEHTFTHGFAGALARLGV